MRQSANIRTAECNSNIFETDEQIKQRLLASARELAPRIAARARDGEQAKRISDDTIREAGEAGFFKIMVPKSMGGYELDWETVCKVVIEACRYDGSSAWQIGFFIMHNWLWLALPARAREEIYSKRGFSTGPLMLATNVKAKPVDGGYVLNGRARWATGINHAEWVTIATLVEGEEADGIRDFIIPVDDVEVHENWDMAGMRATGSHDVDFSNTFVPTYRSANISNDIQTGKAPLAYLGPKYTMPRFTSMIFGSASPLIAVAHGAFEAYQEKVQSYASPILGGKTIDNNAALIRLAKTKIRLDAAEQYLYSIARRMLEWHVEQGALTPVQRVMIRGGVVHVVKEAREIVQSIASVFGSSAYAMDQPIQRYLRDVSMMATHFYHDQDTAYEPLGRVIVGLNPNTRLA